MGSFVVFHMIVHYRLLAKPTCNLLLLVSSVFNTPLRLQYGVINAPTPPSGASTNVSISSDPVAGVFGFGRKKTTTYNGASRRGIADHHLLTLFCTPPNRWMLAPHGFKAIAIFRIITTFTNTISPTCCADSPAPRFFWVPARYSALSLAVISRYFTMDKRARLLALNAFEQKQASRLNSSLKTRNAAMGQPDPELIAVAFGANDVARTPEQERAELEARLARFFKPHISTQIMRHRWLTAANIRDLLEVWYPVVEPHLRNLTGRRAETPAGPGVSNGSPTFIANANRVISNELDNTLQSIPLQLHHQAVQARPSSSTVWTTRLTSSRQRRCHLDLSEQVAVLPQNCNLLAVLFVPRYFQ
eukprot:gene15979-18014_t